MEPGRGWTRRRFLGGVAGLLAGPGLAAPRLATTGPAGTPERASASRRGDAARPDLPLPHLLLLADSHSAHHRYPFILTAAERYRARHPGTPLVTLFNGDLFERGNPVALRGRGGVDLAFLGALREQGPVVFNLGNHEGALTPLEETTELLERMGVTVITSLRRREDGSRLAPPALELREGGMAAVVAGVGTDALATYRPEVRASLSIPAPEAYAAGAFPELFGDVPVPILLSHAGLAADRALLPLLPPGALVLGGHDHLRFAHRSGGSVYLHTGAWGAHPAVAAPLPARPGSSGRVHWRIRSLGLDGLDPDPALEGLRRDAEGEHLTPEDREVVLSLPAPLSLEAAALRAVEGMRRAGAGDAAVIANTTFGSGLPAGRIPLHRYHALVRFDGPLFRIRIPGEALPRILREANQFGGIPFHRRAGEFLVASAAGTGGIRTEGARTDGVPTHGLRTDGTRTLVTDGWVRLNGARYLGPYLGEAAGDPDAFEAVEGTTLREAGLLGLRSAP